ncbi:hypothetical protein TK5_06420 [Sideroxyarcus sp. TK5]
MITVQSVRVGMPEEGEWCELAWRIGRTKDENGLHYSRSPRRDAQSGTPGRPK